MAALAGRVPLSAVRESDGLAAEEGSLGVFGLRTADVGHGRDDLPPHSHPAAAVVRSCVGDDQPEARCLGARHPAVARAGVLPDGVGATRTATAARWCVPAGERLTGLVEVDEAYLGGVEGGVSGRQTDTKAIVAIAVEAKQPRGFGRIRLQLVDDVSKDSLIPFIENAVQPGATVHTDGWQAYWTVGDGGYEHERTIMRAQHDPAHVVMPGVHRVASLLKRWLLGTHQGSVGPEHLDAYLNEFTFRFNRRGSRRRGLLFYRLIEQAILADPITYRSLIVNPHFPDVQGQRRRSAPPHAHPSRGRGARQPESNSCERGTPLARRRRSSDRSGRRPGSSAHRPSAPGELCPPNPMRAARPSASKFTVTTCSAASSTSTNVPPPEQRPE